LAEQQLPENGSVTTQPRVIDETYQPQHLLLVLEGLAGTTANLFLKSNMSNPSDKSAANIEVEGAERIVDTLRVHFPQGSGFVSQQVRISWTAVSPNKKQ
jgi:hypothetical protein